MNVTGYTFTSPSKQQLMEGLAMAIQQRQIGYPDGVIVTELESFEYRYTRTGVQYCLEANTPILTSDLQWKPLKDIHIGDSLVAFDENPEKGNKTRRWRLSRVNDMSFVILPSYKIVMEDGTEIIASDAHQWLVEAAGKFDWRTTAQLRAPHPTSSSLRDVPNRLVRLLDMWSSLRSFEQGYLAAAFDGEGSLSIDKPRLSFSQNDNIMADTVCKYLSLFGFEWGQSQNQATINFLIAGGCRELMRFLGQIRPVRLLPKFNPDKLGCIEKKNLVGIKQLEFLGLRQLIGIETTTKTFIASGFASHNSAMEGMHDDCICALALAIHGTRPVPVEQERIVVYDSMRLVGLEEI